jgi:hypothetical protein
VRLGLQHEVLVALVGRVVLVRVEGGELEHGDKDRDESCSGNDPRAGERESEDQKNHEKSGPATFRREGVSGNLEEEPAHVWSLAGGVAVEERGDVVAALCELVGQERGQPGAAGQVLVDLVELGVGVLLWVPR